jgi:hypothetical protein
MIANGADSPIYDKELARKTSLPTTGSSYGPARQYFAEQGGEDAWRRDVPTFKPELNAA